MGFLAPAILFGLFALTIPPLIHLLNRRRFDVVDWAAMRFLIPSQKTRKKIFLEQLLLLLLRMGLVLLLVLAVASPWLKLPRWLQSIAPVAVVGEGRDIVIVLDGSYSMGHNLSETPGVDATPHDAALSWGTKFLDQLGPADSVALIHARQQPAPMVGYLASDLKLVQSTLRAAPKPTSGGNLPAAVREALKLLQSSKRTNQEIVILTDGQRYGWADARNLEAWELIRNSSSELPRIGVVNVVPDRTGEEPNWSLTPLRATWAVASVGREVKFQTRLERNGPRELAPPKKIRIEVDGRPAGDQVPAAALENGTIPITFTQRFNTPGSHLVSVYIDADPLPGDNRRDFAMEVLPTIPVLIIDGDPKPGRYRGSDFLRDALAPALDTNPAFLVKTYSISDFSIDLLTKPLGRDSSTLPRVLVLANVARLKPDASKAIEEFLNQGGGVLLTLGNRSEAAYYNDDAWRAGKGWLPARLVDAIGDINKIDTAPRILSASLEGPPFDLFKSDDPGTLVGSGYFPRYWKTEIIPESGALPVTLLNSRDPLLVEKPFGKGKVILSAIPFDDTWRSNLIDLGDFVRLSHEMIYYLAAGRSADANLSARQPIVYQPWDGELPGPVTVQPPEATAQRFPVKSWPFYFEDTIDTGVYRLTTDTGKNHYYVVQPDGEESKLAKCTDADKQAVSRLFPNLKYITDPGEWIAERDDPGSRWELWWLLLLLVIVMLLLETRMASKAASG